MTKTVWVTHSVDEATVLGVFATEELAKDAAQADLGEVQPPLIWQMRGDGRFVSTTWDYAVLPFEVIE